jgi:hypothetical protein
LYELAKEADDKLYKLQIPPSHLAGIPINLTYIPKFNAKNRDMLDVTLKSSRQFERNMLIHMIAGTLEVNDRMCELVKTPNYLEEQAKLNPKHIQAINITLYNPPPFGIGLISRAMAIAKLSVQISKPYSKLRLDDTGNPIEICLPGETNLVGTIPLPSSSRTIIYDNELGFYSVAEAATGALKAIYDLSYANPFKIFGNKMPAKKVIKGGSNEGIHVVTRMVDPATEPHLVEYLKEFVAINGSTIEL